MTNQKGFIDLIITKLREEESLDRYLFVLPNIRSAQALYRAIGQINKSSGFAPETITIDQLFSNIAGLRYADPSHQLLTLFSVYKEVVGYKDPFHKFSAMGSALLSDFNEIDQGLIHSEGLFRSLKQMGEMDVQFAEEKRSDLIKNHLKRIELIEKVYPVFKQRLLQTRQGYQGLVYQKAAEKVSQYLEKTVKPHVFIGFNAFSKAEQAVVANLIQSENQVLYSGILIGIYCRTNNTRRVISLDNIEKNGVFSISSNSPQYLKKTMNCFVRSAASKS
jgi:uncharacterized protein (DUF934 family)